MRRPITGAKPDASRDRRSPGPLIFAALLALAMLGYAWTVWDSARGIVDWLLIVPAAILAALALAWACLDDAMGRAASAVSGREEALLPILLLGLTCAYALAIPFAGFDLATAVFIALALAIQGERRPLPVVLSALGGTWAMVWVFRDLLSVRLPTLIL